MIVLTRQNGEQIVVNADLIERVEATPDTTITMTDTKKFVVAESVNEVIDEVRAYRASILMFAGSGDAAPRSFTQQTAQRRLTPVPTKRD